MLRLLLLVLCCVSLNAQHISLAYLKSKPKGTPRDFFIWLYLQEPGTTAKQAKAAYNLIAHKTPKLVELAKQKGALNLIPHPCQGLPLEVLSDKDSACIAIALSFERIFTEAKDPKSAAILRSLQPKLKSYPKLYNALQIVLNPTDQNAFIQARASVIATIYNALSYEQKQGFLDRPFDPEVLAKLASENNPAFNDILRRVILDSHFGVFQKALSHASITNSDSKTFFLLGINALLHQEEITAFTYFDRAQKQADKAFMHDKAVFWKYLLSQNNAYLDILSQSTNPNLFSLYANLARNTMPKYHIVTSLGLLSHKPPKFDIKDPFAWQILKEKILSINNKRAFLKALKSLKTEQSMAHLAYFLERYYNDERHYFLTPYARKAHFKSLEEKAMAYAIARQESLLLPALVSSSYALGLMQIMPFNVAPFAKALGLSRVQLTDMFNPHLSLAFGNYYLNTLKEEFKNPLFVAYCYNGGPKFFRKLLKEHHFFTRGKFEPWLSMERIPCEETRLYGQKVLANYIIYQSIFRHHSHKIHFNMQGFLNTILKDRP
ncbi:lytic transglycosylase domain-containing protein [Helicobacter sp. NHP22-001]|uniref:lytic transglycosylase domain-containing protein n=1 Tax=Helicobacter sp. NHP22-001 TaxID=3040202 RepID=UPI00244D7F96|nr:lytic transglycosylase domain-containing protein [Helicobacter sp. NHP22-001]GMB96551.1 Soluble lytic murein transglycosylase Slt [Helicobacter sp. NHP22-001]